MFFAVVKAICLSGLVSMLPAWDSYFASDLARWQTLFDGPSGTLFNFQQAVSSIWGIHLDKLNHVYSPDGETLAYFHELAMSLAYSAELSFNLRDHDHGLLASQSRWRSSEILRNYEGDQYAATGQESWLFLDRMKASRYADAPSTQTFPETRQKQDKKTSVPICEALNDDPKVHTFSTRATLLMAGFIFGVVLAFFLCTVPVAQCQDELTLIGVYRLSA